MKKLSFCLLLCIILLLPNNVFAEDILNSYDNINSEINIDDLVIEEETEISKIALEAIEEYDIIISGSSVKLDDTNSDIIDNNINMRVSYPDLIMNSLTYSGTYPFTALGSASFDFKLSNIGNAGANNIYVGVYINERFFGKVNIGSLSAGYTYNGNMTLDKVPEGTHAVKIVADVDNEIAESNENNNSITRSFIWIGGTPDLTTTIISPTNGEAKADEKIPFTFYVNNAGQGKGSGTILVEILVDNSVLAKTSINPISVNSKTAIQCNINFGLTLGEKEVKIRVNNDKSFNESNYSNNSSSKKYDIIYCTHFWSGAKFANVTAKDINIQVKSSATNVFSKNIFNRVSDWNGITDKVKINSPNFSDSNTSANIIVEGAVLLEPDTLGQTSLNKLIQLNTDSLSKVEEKGQIRTFLHEVGHAMGLAHPEDDKNCNYRALMRQTKNSLMEYNLTNHDKYNLIKLYK